MDETQVSAAKVALDALLAADLRACDRAGLDRLFSTWRTARGVVDGFEVMLAHRARELAAEGRSECAEAVVASSGRQSGRDARAAAGRERACATMPGFESALAAGALSAGHVDAVAAALNGLDQATTAEFVGFADALLAHAEAHGPDEFAREARDLARTLSCDDGQGVAEAQRKQRRVKRWVDRVTGMHHLHAELDPLSAAKVNSALDAATRGLRAEQGHRDQASWDRDCADALVGLVSGARAVERRVPEIAVHVDWRTLIGEIHEHSLCELSDGTRLPVSTVRRLCCEAMVLPIVLGGPSERLDVGRETRLANPAQRRGLRALHRTCGVDGCPVPFDACEIHHVIPWERHGPTDLANLLPLCGRHHHLVHEGGWTLRIDADRCVTLVRPDGTVHFRGPTVDRPTANQPARWAPAGVRTGRAPPDP